MNKKKTCMFLILTLFIILGLSTISATDITNDTVADDISTDNQIDTVDTQASDNIIYKNIETKTKLRDDGDEEPPASTVEETQTVTDYESLKTAWNDIATNGISDVKYTINVKNGQYLFTEELSIPTTSNITYLTLNGEDVDQTIFDGNRNVCLLNITSTKLHFTINNITLQNGYSTLGTKHPGIYNCGNFTMNNCVVQNNYGRSTGVGLYMSLTTEANITINNSTFRNNTVAPTGYAVAQGAGFYIYQQLQNELGPNYITVTNNYFTGNKASSGFQSSALAASIYSIVRFTSSAGPTYERIFNYSYNIFENTTTTSRQVSNIDTGYTANYFKHTYVLGNVFLTNVSNIGNETYCAGEKVSNATHTFPAINDNLLKNIVSSKDNIKISFVMQGEYEDYAPTQLGPEDYKFYVTTSSDLIDTTNNYLSKDNQYSTILDTSQLGKSFEDITIYLDGREIGTIVASGTNMVLENMTAKAGDTIPIRVEVYDGVKSINEGKVVFKNNGKTLGIEKVRLGTAIFNYTIPDNYKARDYNITAKYAGKNYDTETVSATLTLTKLNTTATITTTDLIAGKNTTITATIKDENDNPVDSGKVSFKINGITLNNTNVINGQANTIYEIPAKYANRTIQITANYGANGKYEQTTTTTNKTIQTDTTKLNTTATITTTDLIAGKNTTITATIKDENDNPVSRGKVSFKINGISLATADVTNGQANTIYEIPAKYANRTIQITANYGANGKYEQTTTTTNKTIQTDTTKVSSNKLSNKLGESYTTDLYVSLSEGSDSNTGSHESPFKTIQKAIDTVATTNTPTNIYILEGNYTGVGNTNLTVPGDLYINFIGEGIDKTIIDGETNYTTSSEGNAWGGTAYYVNSTGNWFMNITTGNGKISLINFTVENGWVHGVDGGDDISKYPITTIDNHAVLEVTGMRFYKNHGGTGGAIRNNANSTLIVKDSLFEENTKGESTGNFGAAFYNNGTATATNTTFLNNWARWGTVTNDAFLNISNCTFQGGIAYEGGSTFKYGSGIAANTGGANFFNMYGVGGITTLVDNCNFINNKQTDIYNGGQVLNVTNCNFTSSSGIYSATSSAHEYIINNTFTKMIPSSLSGSLSSSQYCVCAINVTSNATIENNVITTNGTYAGNAIITLRGSNNVIRNVTGDRRIVVHGDNNIIDHVNITTRTDTYAIQLDSTSYTKNNISNCYLVAKELVGTDAVDIVDKNYVLNNNNTPQSTMIRLNDTNFFRYFDENEYYMPIYGDNITINIIGSLYDKIMKFENVTNITIYQQNTRFKSDKVSILTNETKLTIRNLYINNTDREVLILGSDNNIIQSSRFNTTTANAIIINGKNNTIQSVTINSTNNNPIEINGDNNTIKSNTINTKEDYTIIINGNDNIIQSNNLVADLLVGNESVKDNGENNDISSNNPTYKNYVVTNDNYSTYFDENGNFIQPEGVSDVRLLFDGEFYNKMFIFNSTVTVGKYHSTTLYNSTIKSNNASITLANITIINNNQKEAIYIFNTTNLVTISNNTIKTDNTSIILDKVYRRDSPIITYNNITTISDNKVFSILVINNNNTENIQRASIGYNNIYTVGDSESASISVNHDSPEDAVDLPINIGYNNITTIFNNKTKENDIIYSIVYEDLRYGVDISYNNNILTIGKTKAISIYANLNKTINNKVQTGPNSYYNHQNPFVSVQRNTIKTIAEDTAMNLYVNIVMPIQERYDIQENNLYTCAKNSTNILLENICMNYIGNKFSSDSEYNIGLYITNSNNNKTIKDNTFTMNSTDGVDILLINSTHTKITNNTIITKNPHTIALDENSTSNSITYNYLMVGTSKFGDDTVENNGTNRVRDNEPILSTNLLLTDDTYEEFFDENGVLRDEFNGGQTIEMLDSLYNRVMIFNKPVNFIETRGTLYNTTIILDNGSDGSTFTDIMLNNTDIENTLTINSDNNTFNIKDLRNNNTEVSNPIIINGNNNSLAFEMLQLSGISSTALRMTTKDNTTVFTINGNENYLDIKQPHYIAIRDNINDVNVKYMEINGNKNIIDSTQNIYTSVSNSNHSTFLNITIFEVNSDENNIEYAAYNSYGADYFSERYDAEITEIFLNNANGNKIIKTSTGNTIFSEHFYPLKVINSTSNIVNGSKIRYYTDGSYCEDVKVLFENSDNNIVENATWENVVVLLKNSDANEFMYNTISYYNGNFTFEIDEKSQNNTIKHNTLTTELSGGNEVVSEAMNNTVAYNAPPTSTQKIIAMNTTIPNVSRIGNTIIINSTMKYNNGTASVPNWITVDTGTLTLKINNEIVDTTSIVEGTAVFEYTIPDTDVEVLNVTVIYEDNMEFALNRTFGKITLEKLDTTVTSTIETNTTHITINTDVVDSEGNPVTDGTIVLSANGVNFTNVTVENGQANYTGKVNANWTNKNNTITTEYLGTNLYINSSTENTIEINKRESTIEFIIPKTTYKAGETITITVLVKEGSTLIPRGKVAFKLNGITLKDENGKALYAIINNGIGQITYTLDNLAAREYTLIAVYGDTYYERAEANTTIEITKGTTHIEANPIKTSTNTTTITAKILNGDNQQIKTTTKVTIKINGVTVVKGQNVNDGLINFTVDTPYKTGVYDVEIITGDSKAYTSSRMTTTLVIQK